MSASSFMFHTDPALTHVSEEYFKHGGGIKGKLELARLSLINIHV